MTEKRFTVPIKYRFSHSKIQLNGEPLTNDELVRILNTNDGAFVENFFLKQENRELQRHLDVMRSGALTDDKRIKELYDENEQLKQQLKEKDDFIDEVWRKYEDAHGLSIDNTDWF